MNGDNVPRMDRIVRSLPREHDADLEMIRYYLSRPIEERLAAVEQLRQMYHGKDYATTARLSRSAIRIQRRRR